jgi:aminoglycoside phosphotransferase (APT) family kinase protein
MSFGQASVTYQVDAGDVRVIVRTNTDPSAYAGTVANLDRLRDIGMPVPHVIHADLTCEGLPFAYVMTDVFPGRDLRYELASMTEPQRIALAERIVGFERQATALPRGDGYGFVPIGAPGPHRTWPDAIRADRAAAMTVGDPVSADEPVGAGAGDLVGAGELAGAGDLMRAVNDCLAGAEPRLASVEPVCFLDDLTIKNVIVSGGQLQGIVDFDVVCYGDPMYWLALTQVAVLSDIGVAGQSYVDELVRLWGPSDVERANLALYCAVHAIAFLGWDTADAQRRQRLVDATQGWLAASQ